MTKIFCEYIKPNAVAIILALVISVVVALGFKFTTPAAAITTLDQRVTAIEISNRSDHLIITALARLACLQISPEQTSLAGLDCRNLLNR